MSDKANVNSSSEQVVEFCTELSRRMILSGANLERVQLAVKMMVQSQKVCKDLPMIQV